MEKIETIGKFTPIGMRTKVDDPNAIVINTCGKNDASEAGTFTLWAWANPTNRAIVHRYEDIGAVSLECLWQGTKLLKGQTRPDDEVLQGNWRKNKGKRPIGAYAGPNAPLITSPGEARRPQRTAHHKSRGGTPQNLHPGVHKPRRLLDEQKPLRGHDSRMD